MDLMQLILGFLRTFILPRTALAAENLAVPPENPVGVAVQGLTRLARSGLWRYHATSRNPNLGAAMAFVSGTEILLIIRLVLAPIIPMIGASASRIKFWCFSNLRLWAFSGARSGSGRPDENRGPRSTR